MTIASAEPRPETHGTPAKGDVVSEGFGGGSPVKDGGAVPADETSRTQSVRTLVLTCASEIKPRRVTWLWDSRVPRGEITLTPGVGGIGKSTFHAWFIAQVTSGKLSGEYKGTPKAAIICASEDSWERTIVPRLMAAEADLGKVYRVEVSTAGESVRVTLPADIKDLATQIQAHDVAVVSLDPMMSLISGSIDTHKDADVRQAMEPLSKLADDTGCSILGNAHFNKAMVADPMMRLTGSAAFGQVVRAVLAFARDEGGDVCVISQAKNNLGRLDLPSLSYTIESVDVDTEDGPTSVGKLVMGKESQRSVQDILGDQGHSENRSARGEAERFLREVLKNGPKPASECQAEAKEAGITEKTLRNAKERICEIVKDGFTGGWVWSLNPEGAPQTPKVPLSQDGAPWASSGAPSADATESSGIPASDLLPRDTPPDTCPACRQAQWWTDRLSGRRVCSVCYPPSSPEAEA